MIKLILYLWCTCIHTSRLTTSISTLKFITLLIKNLLEVTLFIVEIIIVVRTVSKVVMFIRIYLFLFLHVDYYNACSYYFYYCYHNHYFIVCALWFISSIVLSIKSNVVGNSKVRVVVCFYWIQFPYNWTHSILLMHSNSYFKTQLHYFLIIFVLAISQIKPLSS